MELPIVSCRFFERPKPGMIGQVGNLKSEIYNGRFAMAVAVKNSPETSAPSIFSRLPAASLAGMVYVLAGLALVFYALPWVWGTAISPSFPPGLSFVNTALLVLVMAAAAVGWVVVGLRLAGPRS